MTADTGGINKKTPASLEKLAGFVFYSKPGG